MDEHRPDEGRGEVGGPSPPANTPYALVSPKVLEASEAFRSELPGLLEERPGQWVGYHGTERIGFAATKEEMYRRCRERGLDEDDFLVTCIEPEEDLMFGPGAILDIFSGEQE
jgi:hypothetical protein